MDCKEIQPVYTKGDQSWVFTGRTDVEAETPIFRPLDVKNWLILKRPWCWERLSAGGKGDSRGWDGWMASPTQWTWVWVNSGSWWWTGRPGVLWFMGLQGVGHDWVNEMNWTELKNYLQLTCASQWQLERLWPVPSNHPLSLFCTSIIFVKKCDFVSHLRN